jgi:hypothetical protein
MAWTILTQYVAKLTNYKLDSCIETIDCLFRAQISVAKLSSLEDQEWDYTAFSDTKVYRVIKSAIFIKPFTKRLETCPFSPQIVYLTFRKEAL